MTSVNSFKTTVMSLMLFLVVFTFFVRKINSNRDVFDYDKVMGENIDVRLGEVNYIFSKGECKQWILEAKSACVYRKGNRTVLDQINVDFFSVHGDKVHFSARSGTIDVGSNCISVSGNVSGHDGVYTFKTEGMAYNPNTSCLRSGTPAIIVGDNICIKGETVMVDLSSKIIKVTGNVESVLNGDVAF